MNIPDTNCSFLTDTIYNQMTSIKGEVDIVDKEMWELAALRIYEVFCRCSDRPLNLENFIWTKEVALRDIKEDYELKGHSECDKIYQKVEKLFNDTLQQKSKEIYECYKKQTTPTFSSRNLQTFFKEFKKNLKDNGFNSEAFNLDVNCLLTYQIIDMIKQGLVSKIPKENALKIEQIFDQTFAKVKWQNTLNENNISSFLELYRNFVVVKDRDHENSYFLKDQWITDKNHVFDLSTPYCDEFDYKNLEVTNQLEEIKEIYQEHGVIQLRPIDKKATTLIIGCGNNRISDAGSKSLPFCDETWCIDSTYGDYIGEYSLKHSHDDAVTIDPSLSANPTILAYFGDQPISQLFKGQKFDRIIFEGYFNPMPQKFRKSDILELLSDDGMLFEDVGRGPWALDMDCQKIIDSEI